MKYTTKKGICKLNLLLAFLALLIIHGLCVLEFTQDKQQAVLGCIVWMTVSIVYLVMAHVALKWDVKNSNTKKSFVRFGVISLVIVLLICLLFVALPIESVDVIPVRLVISMVIWALIGGVYLLLGLTKTKYDEGDKTIPYSD